MKLKDIVSEDFSNYKDPSMFLITAECDWKCCTEQGLDINICQNSPLAQMETKDIPIESIYQAFVSNPITKAVVIGGLEPFKQIDEVVELIQYFRSHDENCPIIIYTGYYPHEISDHLWGLSSEGNIIIKFGRYKPNTPKRFDDILGVELASDNQWAAIISF